MKTIYIVIPCYNEEDVLLETAKQLLEKFKSLRGVISEKSRIVFVNDGSQDRTWELIEHLHQQNAVFSGINLSRNRGHQNALLAGLMTVKQYCDAVISMDADLQDDINAIDEMIEKYYDGCDIVYGVRNSRTSDSFFKRITAQGFYRMINRLGAHSVYNHADYRLMSRRALDGLEQFKEVNLFIRGLVPMIGYQSDIVYYERHKRFAGKSKYPFRKMLSFAFEGVTSLSTKPIRMISALGCVIFLVSLGMLVWSVVGFFHGETEPGWASIMVSIWGIGGLLLLAIGIVGEYIGKMYLEIKERPRYLIADMLHDTDSDDSADSGEKTL